MSFGLVGKKLSHSYSKLIHDAIGGYEFNLYEVAEGDFDKFITDRQYQGLTVTIPYKVRAMQLADEVSELATEAGCVNVLYFSGKDKKVLMGDNTDYKGFLYMAERAGIRFAGRKVLILGDGGVSLTLRKAVKDHDPAQIKIATRKFEGYSPEERCNAALSGYEYIKYEDIPQHYDAEIIINATSVGTYPHNYDKLISIDGFFQCCSVLDVVYNPFATDLLLQARDRGIPHSNGLPMLVAQATAAAKLFTGGTLPDGRDPEDLNDKLISALEESLTNIVLIGMPGAGKTTLGQAYAKALGRSFLDMDRLCEEGAKMPVPEIIEKYGESAFRDLETVVAKGIGKEHSQVIATGGGAILRKETMDALRQNGKILWLDVPIENLALEGRPLSKDRETVRKLYAERKPLYEKYADEKIGLPRDGNTDK